MDDRDIVDLYWQRSDQAIAESEKKYGRYCHRIASGICTAPEDAEECVNDTWLRAWNSMPPERPSPLSAFLGTITRRLALDRYRSGKSLKRGGGEVPLVLEELEECLGGGADPEKEVELREMKEAVGRFADALPETERLIFVSRYWFMVPVAEIAGRLGCSEAKVKTTMFRVRKRLRSFLEEEKLC